MAPPTVISNIWSEHTHIPPAHLWQLSCVCVRWKMQCSGHGRWVWLPWAAWLTKWCCSWSLWAVPNDSKLNQVNFSFQASNHTLKQKKEMPQHAQWAPSTCMYRISISGSGRHFFLFFGAKIVIRMNSVQGGQVCKPAHRKIKKNCNSIWVDDIKNRT